MPADLHYLSLDEVARRLKAREVSSVEATQAILDRIAKLDPKLKSYATLTPERALADAAARDAEIAAGKSRGPLHGVPIAVKDLCNTAGIPTAAGMAIHRANVPAKDATVVARLKAAGAVILGKLQMTEGAFGTHHPSIPPPVNPWNAAYWSGASSSGSGVATGTTARLGVGSASSLVTRSATWRGRTGLVRKSLAPMRSAATARSMVAWPVMNSTFSGCSVACEWARSIANSMPDMSGIRMSLMSTLMPW